MLQESKFFLRLYDVIQFVFLYFVLLDLVDISLLSNVTMIMVGVIILGSRTGYYHRVRKKINYILNTNTLTTVILTTVMLTTGMLTTGIPGMLITVMIVN